MEEYIEFGCSFCYDAKKDKEKEIFFIDAANNLRLSKFCPWCGRMFSLEEAQ